jgi:hypothetical protein
MKLTTAAPVKNTADYRTAEASGQQDIFAVPAVIN